MYITGRFQVARWMAVRWARIRPGHQPSVLHHHSLLEDVNVDRVVVNLKTDGVFHGLHLSRETLSELQLFCERSLCFGNGERTYPFFIADKANAEQTYGTKFSVARYLDCLTSCPTLQHLATDPILIAIARRYMGADPVLIGGRIWWSFPANSGSHQQAVDGQSFHYDLDDYRALAFLFYLSDVDHQNGPHVCVRGSHRRKPLHFVASPFKSKSDQKILSTYGPNQILPICGPAGFGFAEDLFCYHKGLHPQANSRLVLQIRYGLWRYGNQGPGE